MFLIYSTRNCFLYDLNNLALARKINKSKGKNNDENAFYSGG